MQNAFVSLVVVLSIILISVILHELAHGVVAYWLGDHTAKDAGRLTLNPLKHIDPYMSILVPVILYLLGAPVFGGAKPVPINPNNVKGREWGMALVALAGPFTNFLIALIFFLIGHFTHLLYGSGGDLWHFIFSEFIYINLGFMIFNLIPIPPLDGSRLLYAIAPDFLRKIMLLLEQYGLFIVYALILLCGPIFSQFMYGALDLIMKFFYFLVGQ